MLFNGFAIKNKIVFDKKKTKDTNQKTHVPEKESTNNVTKDVKYDFGTVETTDKEYNNILEKLKKKHEEVSSKQESMIESKINDLNFRKQKKMSTLTKHNSIIDAKTREIE